MKVTIPFYLLMVFLLSSYLLTEEIDRVRKHLVLTGYVSKNDLMKLKSNCQKIPLLSIGTSDSETQRQPY